MIYAAVQLAAMLVQPEVLTTPGVAHATRASIDADFWAELAQIKAESIGWVPLGERGLTCTMTKPHKCGQRPVD